MNKLEMTKIHIRNIVTLMLIMSVSTVSNATSVFGYKSEKRDNLEIFPKWLSVLERNIKQNAPQGNCAGRGLDQCHLRNWLDFLEDVRELKIMEQLERVNAYANKHKYILDITNYGVNDYWATPREFLNNNGDCEDYAIIKMLSLKILGVSAKRLKLIILQDTNLRIPHAVLSVDVGNDVLIMDNQIEEVISHKYILHYVPVYAVDDKQWWIYFPI